MGINKRTILSILSLVVLASGVVSLLSVNTASAAPVDDVSIADRTRLFEAYSALGRCVGYNYGISNTAANKDWSQNNLRDDISKSKVDGRDFFSDSSAYHRNSLGVSRAMPFGWLLQTRHDNGSGYCNDAWLGTAIRDWGFKSNGDFLCAIGYTQPKNEEGSPCGPPSTHDYRIGENKTREAIQKKFYGGKEPVADDAMRYYSYSETLSQGCGLRDAAGQGPNSANIWRYSGSKREPVQEWKQVDDKEVYVARYSGFYGQHDKRKCIEILNILTDKKWANAYSKERNERRQAEIDDRCSEFATGTEEYDTCVNGIDEEQASQENPVGNSGETQTPDETCRLGSMGWVLCPMLEGAGAAIDSIQGFFDTALDFTILVNNGDSDDDNTLSSIIQGTWRNILNIANILFAIAFIIIIYSQATGGGLTNYSIKKILPRLVIAAVLVNLSFWICALLADVSNIIGASISSFFANLGVGYTGVGGDTGNAAGVVTAVILAGLAAAIILFFFLGPALLALIMILAAIIARQIILVVLVVISPLAFVAWLLPNTEQWFKKWWTMYVRLLVAYPLVMLAFAAGKFVSDMFTAMANTGENDWFYGLMALGALIIPVFAILPALKFGGGVMGMVSGAVSKFGGQKLADASEKGRDLARGATARGSTGLSSWSRGGGRGRRALGGAAATVLGAASGSTTPHGVRRRSGQFSDRSASREEEDIKLASQQLARDSQVNNNPEALMGILRREGATSPRGAAAARRLSGMGGGGANRLAEYHRTDADGNARALSRREESAYQRAILPNFSSMDGANRQATRGVGQEGYGEMSAPQLAGLTDPALRHALQSGDRQAVLGELGEAFRDNNFRNTVFNERRATSFNDPQLAAAWRQAAQQAAAGGGGAPQGQGPAPAQQPQQPQPPQDLEDQDFQIHR